MGDAKASRPAFSFRASPARRPLLWVGGLAFATITIGLIVVGRGHPTGAAPARFINGVFWIAAWGLLLRGLSLTSRLALTQRGVVFASSGSGSGFIPWDAIDSARLVRHRGIPFLEVRSSNSAAVESSRRTTKKTLARRGTILVCLHGFRTSPQMVEATVSRFLDHPEDRVKIGTGEGLRLLTQSLTSIQERHL